MADVRGPVSETPENTAGATSDALNQRPSSAASGKSLPAGKAGAVFDRRRDPNSQTLHWFAHVGADSLQQNSQVPAQEQQNQNASPAGKENAALQREREERLRVLREKQNEERQRKLEELKQQALAAQKFREQKEEERRRRIEEMRQRDGDRRHQVEERKRQIIEAEQERREAILRKNQEREARIEMKRKNERSSIVFAFGSSTPRMLEPADTGGSYWATRRATSTTTLFSGAPLTLTRRGSERDLDGSKKRATSASGLDRKPGVPDDETATSPDGVGSGYITPRSGAARRKTDLIPTIPSPRDGPPARQSRRPSGNTPNRAYSMSRLDQLSQPRKILPRPGSGPNQTVPERPPRTGGSKGTLSSAKSMGHLAGRLSAATGSVGSQSLARSDTSRSMTQLCVTSPVPPPRMTRAERLRRRAREQAAKSQQLDTQQQGLRSGETTPSRPLSAMSQQSMSSVSSSVGAPLRSRPVAAPRRPRPVSIAITGVTIDPPPRHSLSSEHKRQAAAAAAAAAVASSNGTGDKPPVPRPGSSSRKTSSDRMTASMFGSIPCSDNTSVPPKKPPKTVKASPRATPKATPLQSPRTDNAPGLPQDSNLSQTKVSVPSPKATTPAIQTPAPNTVANSNAPPPQLSPAVSETISVTAQDTVNIASTEQAVPLPPDTELTFHQVEQKHQEQIWEAQRQMENNISPTLPSASPSASTETDLVDMTASMIAKQRITTEEEAKAALAERRRLAREQAEREAELERQRIEAERLAEEDRLRQEEEDQRRFEEEQERLAEEARQAEEQRLLQAIEEAQKREEEDRKKREEEAQQKAEKEEAERKAKEEAEKQRKEMELKLKREEEERMERRKRVEAIMLRTRGKGTTPTSTPTRENGDLNQGENEELQSPESAQEVKPVSPATTSSQSNGHSNGMDSIKQNNATNVLLDLTEHNSVSSGHDLLGPLANEDCINSNLNANNGLSNGPPPFIASFHDSALSKKQDSNVVTDLLS